MRCAQARRLRSNELVIRRSLIMVIDPDQLARVVGGASVASNPAAWGVEPRTPYGMFGTPNLSYQERAAEIRSAEQASLDAGIVTRNGAGVIVPR
jgi:hypothetical protein